MMITAAVDGAVLYAHASGISCPGVVASRIGKGVDVRRLPAGVLKTAT